MPRNIDYKGRAKANETRRQLYRKSAIINALRDNDINKAEFLSETNLVPKPTAVETLIKQEEVSKATKPVVEAIQNIPTTEHNKISSDKNLDKDIELDMDTEIDQDLIDSLGLSMPSEMLGEEYDFDYLRDSFKTAQELRNDVSRRIGGMKRSNEYKEASPIVKETMLADLENDRSSITRYMMRVKEMMNNRTVLGKGIMTSIKDVIQRFKLLVGHIQAGNTNKAIKNEVSDIAHYLYSEGYLSKNLYSNLMNNI